MTQTMTVMTQTMTQAPKEDRKNDANDDHDAKIPPRSNCDFRETYRPSQPRGNAGACPATEADAHEPAGTVAPAALGVHARAGGSRRSGGDAPHEAGPGVGGVKSLRGRPRDRWRAIPHFFKDYEGKKRGVPRCDLWTRARNARLAPWLPTRRGPGLRVTMPHGTFAATRGVDTAVLRSWSGPGDGNGFVPGLVHVPAAEKQSGCRIGELRKGTTWTRF